MLSRVEQNGMFHVDGTYKIIKYNFPLIVLGITDMERHFHPIAFMFTSHEQEQDYVHFFSSLLNECRLMGYKFEPKFFCTDASGAIANAIEHHFSKSTSPHFSNCVVIMCYFHLRMNIKKQKGFKNF
jgi:hypothetical protein